jgi:quercetin dioxygenase-like cupin family protein
MTTPDDDSGGDAVQTVERPTPEPATVWFGDALMQVMVDGAATNGALSIVEAWFPEGYSPPVHVHSREDELCYLLEGTLRCVQGEREFVAHGGDVVVRPRHEPHTFRVVSPGARALMLYTPAGFEDFYTEAGAPAYATSEPPPADYTEEEARMFAERFGYETVGPRLGE